MLYLHNFIHVNLEGKRLAHKCIPVYVVHTYCKFSAVHVFYLPFNGRLLTISSLPITFVLHSMALNALPYSDNATPSSNMYERPAILRTETIPGSISDAEWQSASPTALIPPEAEMSEEQLRVLYDDEEIDRFLHLFSAVSLFCSLLQPS